MASDLVIALGGGAVGSVVTLAARLSAVPGDVDRHDRQARALDEDLAYWVADDDRKLRQELDGITNDHAGRGLLNSSVLTVERMEAKTRALQRYRDQLAGAERNLAEAVAAEGWAHGLWRKVRRCPRPELETPGRVEPVIEEWRVEVTSDGNRKTVYDPTRRMLGDLLRDVEERRPEPS